MFNLNNDIVGRKHDYILNNLNAKEIVAANPLPAPAIVKATTEKRKRGRPAKKSKKSKISKKTGAAPAVGHCTRSTKQTKVAIPGLTEQQLKFLACKRSREWP